MATESAQAAGSLAAATNVPWNQIPKFIPGETDMRVYSRKLEFLQALWPKDQLEHLGPRAALLVEGVAFQKVSRLDPAKLREANGVEHLVKCLGGQWGRLDEEEKLDLFEKALYQVCQKQDESNDSYLARHDAAFEDLLGRKVSLEEVRAYVLLRQSLLPSEDRKKVIMEDGGALSYDKARKQIRLLGSRFFQDLQMGSGTKNTKLKTYDINHVDDEGLQGIDEDEDDEEAYMAMLLESGDEDASFVNEFEEQILLACQESQELSACFSAYQDARNRLREKARARGFWPLGANNKGRGRNKGSMGKGKNSGLGKGMMNSAGAFNRRRSLADRIANSTCRRCGRPGHWKRECPLALTAGGNGNPKKATDPESFAGLMIDGYETEIYAVEPAEVNSTEVIDALPSTAKVYVSDDELEAGGRQTMNSVSDGGCDVIVFGEEVLFGEFGNSHQLDLTTVLTTRLQSCCRNTDSNNAANAADSCVPVSGQVTFLPGKCESMAGDNVIFQTEEADDEAIIDTGASKAVIGESRLKRLVQSFPKDLRSKVMRVPTDGVVFKFGNAGRLASRFAILLPRAQNDWLRVEVVPGETPFLISNAVLTKLQGVVDVADKCLCFKNSKDQIPLFGVRKNLLGVKESVLYLMAVPPTAPYLTKMLTSPIDQTLQQKQDHQEMPETWTRPPGISTLEEWGRLKSLSGKHQNRTFEDLYQNERGYTKQIWNRKAVTSWIRSFQLFCRHRREASVEFQEQQARAQGLQMPISPHMTPEVQELIRQGGAPWWSPRRNAQAIQAKAMAKSATSSQSKSPEEQEWQVLQEKTLKRGMTTESTENMETQPNAEKVNQLQAQIAILQRDLQRELQGPSTNPEGN
eukprot:s2024_g15.t1